MLDRAQSLCLSSLLLDKEVFWKLIQRTKICTQLHLNPVFFCKMSQFLVVPLKIPHCTNRLLKQNKCVARIQAGHAVQMATLPSSCSNVYSVFWGFLISKISSYRYSVNHRVGQLTTARMRLKQLPADHRAAQSRASGHPFLLLLQ